MGSFQSIAIGINRYHFLRAINDAEADARVFYQFLIEEANIPTQQSLLLTDIDKDRSTYPNRDNLLSWLEINTPLSSASLFWFFFSGYAMNYQGEDYLIPIDGNPEDIAGTGISLRSLFASLQKQGAKQVLAILDLHPVGKEKMRVGQKAIALAKQMKTALILHSQPDELSERSMFVAALLEAFRHYRHKITLAKIEQYLRDRLPEFSLDLWHPTQSAVVVSPSPEASHLLLLAPSNLQPVPTGATAIALPKLPDPPIAYPTPEINLPQEKVEIARVRKKPNSWSLIQKIARFKWFFLGLGCSLIPSLLLAVAVFNLIYVKQPSSSEVAETDSQKSAAIERDLLNRARIFLKTNQASDFNRAIGKVREIKSTSTLYRDALAEIDRWSQIILDIAEGRARTGDFIGAIAAAELVPRDRATFYQMAQQKIQLWKTLQAQQLTNQDLIEAARETIDRDRATTYGDAIAILRQIPPEQPNYEEARHFMNNWSQKIYFLALARATEGDFQTAIETAELIPPDMPLYEDARRAIARWQKEIGDRE